ncbi:MAG: glycosyltransferase family 4 protein [Nitrospirae bacterium]|nr:glycosyltransferase family 4 protein [Nitrospirota bacterium]
MTIIYPVPEILPDPRARFIQIMNTCHAIAKTGTEVILMAGFKKGFTQESVLRFYGISAHPRFKIIPMPIIRREQKRYFKFSWHGTFHFSLLMHLLFSKSFRNKGAVLFIRHIKLAGFVLKCRRFIKNPLVFEVHEIFSLNANTERKRERMRDLENKVYRGVDAIISITRSIREYLITAGIPAESLHVVQNGIETEWLVKERSTPGSYICYTGSLYPWKGVDTLILAMKYLPGEKLLIVGGGGRIEELKQLARSEGVAGRVEFAGAVPRTVIQDYLSRSKVAVLPNIPSVPSQFSSPLKLFEYMAYGIPIVASDMPAFQEILTHGRNAILVEPGDSLALAKGIKTLMDDPELASRIARAAREDARNYTYDKRAEKILGVIKALAV